MSVVAIEQPRRSIIAEMAEQHAMEPGNFEATLRATVFPKSGTREEFAAFLMVARRYDLDPLTRQIYAFPKKGGGIQPIVSVDGWSAIINSHPAFDGMAFDDHRDDDGKLFAITCRIWRKDRAHTIEATEYLSECKRNTDVWQQWAYRMLRHKAMIQAARYAFGFAGIVDPDEAERFTVREPGSRPPLATKLERLAQHPRPVEPQPQPQPIPPQPEPEEDEDEDDQAATMDMDALHEPEMPDERAQLLEALQGKAHQGKLKLRLFKGRLRPDQIDSITSEEWASLDLIAALADNPPRAEDQSG